MKVKILQHTLLPQSRLECGGFVNMSFFKIKMELCLLSLQLFCTQILFHVSIFTLKRLCSIPQKGCIIILNYHLHFFSISPTTIPYQLLKNTDLSVFKIKVASYSWNIREIPNVEWRGGMRETQLMGNWAQKGIEKKEIAISLQTTL